MDLITSTANPTIKRARLLADRRHRRKEGAFLVEGGQPVWRAVEAGWPLEAIIVAPDLLRHPDARAMVADLRSRGTRVLDVTPEVFASLTDREGPGGIAAIVGIPHPQLADLTIGPDDVVVICEHVGNPGNLGTIIRTADATGVTAVVTLGESTDPYSPAAVKASMGSLFALPVVAASIPDCLSWRQQQGLHLVATSGGATQLHWETEYPRPVGLLLGNEGEGLTDDMLAAADVTVRIPMTGTAESLNLSVAAAVMMYEVIRPPRN